MLIVLVNWTYFFFVFFVYGFSVRSCVIADNEEYLRENFLVYVFLGIALTTGISLWLNLFIPLGFAAELIVLAGAVILSIPLLKNRIIQQLFQKKVKVSPLLLGILIVSVLLVFNNSLNPPANPDTGIYHAQTIRWVENFPAVPGLGNLHSRLAFNSSWLVMNALFSFSDIFSQSLHVLPSFLFLVTILYLIQQSKKLIQENKKIEGLISITMLPLLFITLSSQISSPGTDMPVVLLLSVIFVMSISWFSENRNRLYLLAVQTLVILLVTIKLSALPVILLPIMLLVLTKKQLRRVEFLQLIVIGVFLMVPWMIRSVIQSGYLIYPIHVPDIFAFDWKIPIEKVIDEQNIIRAWAKVPRMDAAAVQELSFLKWLSIWIQNISGMQRIVVGVSILSPITLLLFVFSGKYRESYGEKIKVVLSIYLVAYTGLIYWFFSAPDIRFGYAFIIPCLGIACAIALKWFFLILPTKKIRELTISLLQAAVFLMVAQIFIFSIDTSTIKQYWLMPADYPKLSTTPIKIDGKVIYTADYYNECWYNPFPCIPQPVAGIENRGDDFRSGFRASE